MDKLENSILYILTRAKQRGKRNLSKFELFKLLYMLEVESRKFAGKSFFEDRINFVREKNGPISPDVYDALNNLSNEYIQITKSKKPDYPFARHSISLKKQKKKFDLEDSEKLFINSVLESYLKLPMNKLKEIVYDTIPMKKIREEEKVKNDEILKGHQLDLSSIPLDEDLVDLIAA